MKTLTHPKTVSALMGKLDFGQETPVELQEWLSPAQMAEELDLHMNTVYKILRRREFPVYDLTVRGGSRYYRVKRSDLEQWLESRRR